LAVRWKLSRQRIHQLIKQGQIPSVFVGKVRMPLRKVLEQRS